jgi:uncharacterized protein
MAEPSTSPTRRVKINIPTDQIAEICSRWGIRRLALFGSVLRDDFRADSDVDMLVEFEPERTPGFAFITLKDELSSALGREVDLNTYNSLSEYFRDRVMGEAEMIYDRD